MGQNNPSKFSAGTKAARWVDSTEKGTQPVGEVGKQKIHKVQQRTMQSPEPGMEKPRTAVQAGNWQSTWQLCKKGLGVLIDGHELAVCPCSREG